MRRGTMKRGIACSATLLALAGCAALGLKPPSSSASHSATLSPVAFDALPGWSTDHLAEAAAAFARGCARIITMPPDQALGGSGEAARLGGQAGQWTAACNAARALPPNDDAAARTFFEASFQPYAVSDDGSAAGLFTGYYEPEVAGSRTRSAAYDVPLLARPPDLVTLDPAPFAPELSGHRTAGRVQQGAFVPYWDRAQIEAGALPDRLALLWLADPVDLFFLQVQGAGRVRLPDGSIVRVGFAGQNGRSYVPIGRLLIERGQLAANDVSEASIRAWLAAHPGEAKALMDENPSYVFFRELHDTRPDRGPPGALGVSLTPERSIAVDRTFLPLGAPVWIATTDPLNGTPMQRLTVAQDIGGALQGAVRSDIFFGWSKDAAARAGRMRAPGTEYVLLPKS